MEDIRLIKELQEKLDDLKPRYNKKINDIHEVLDQLLRANNEEKDTTKSQE